jgi:hypothetical protein
MTANLAPRCLTSFPICEPHRVGEYEYPSYDGLDCIHCRVSYLEAQESLLQEWQDRAKAAEEHADEVTRPLDAQMARLNERVVALNEENTRLKRALSDASGPRPCCGEYETCTRACTPRGEQMAYRKADSYAVSLEGPAHHAETVLRGIASTTDNKLALKAADALRAALDKRQEESEIRHVCGLAGLSHLHSGRTN